MSQKPPHRPGIIFEVGARVEAQDYLQKWYPSRIEKIDYEEGKMLVHFDRWSHRYDEWIFWDSSRLRPLERPALRKEGMKEEEEICERLSEMRASRLREHPGSTESTEDQTESPQTRQDLRSGEEVLARWTDCRYYPAKIESVNKEGTYTVQFYDGVIRCVKRMHIKSMPEDAKGQDWIALVKAATAAAKNRGSCKPRTSANSNKDKEDRRAGKASPKREDDTAPDIEAQDVTEPQEEPESAEKLEEEPKQAPEQPETVKMKRRRGSLGSSFHAKRARLNTITGLLVSKVTNEDEREFKEEQKQATEGPSASAEDQNKPEIEAILPASVQQGGTPPATSPIKHRNRRLKHDSGESTGSQKQSKSSSTVMPVGEEVSLVPSVAESAPVPSPGPRLPDNIQSALPTPPPPSSPWSSEHSQRRRRSQRLAYGAPDTSLEPTPPPPSAPEGKELDAAQESTPDPAVPEDKPGELDTTCVALEKPAVPLDLSVSAPPASTPPPSASPPPPPQPPETEGDQILPETPSPALMAAEQKMACPTAAAVLKAVPRALKPNKHAREPIINTKKLEDSTSPKEPLIDLDHNKFKCKIPGCSKAFRKAKLLDYHLKYYHSADKETESETGSPERAVRTRATSASVPTCTPPESHDAKRRRTVSTSASLSPHVHALQLESPLSTSLKPAKSSKKKRSSASVSSEGTEIQLPLPPREKSFESLHEKILKKVIEKDKHSEPGQIKTEKKIKLEEKSQPIGKKKEKDKERKEKKEKDPFKIKQKKKKKKKKKSKQHSYSDFDDLSLAFLERCSSPLNRSSGSSFTVHNTSASKHTTFQYPRAILSVDLTGENLSDIDFLEDSSTESLLLSGDEYNQDFDSLTMDDFPEEEDAANEIVRCICEMDEENGFMIQCEECMCWQHSVCMGLLEDSIPEQYICYICRDPPGQRWSAKYRHDKDWLNKGHMYGLSFLSENYSHQNAKKIVSTHQLLADVYSVKKVLHGLQLKMDILQNKHNPDLHLWARSWMNSDEDQPMGGHPDCIHYQDRIADSINQNSNPETYITSEHSYQRPPGLGLDHRLAADLLSSDGEEGVRLEEGLELVAETATHTLQFVPKDEQESTAIAVSGGLSEHSPEAAEQARNRLQWQLNLLTHIEDVQNEVAGRMDLIEKELDVLESWLDFTGELEPPDPLARLPQLKRRIKQLLTDLGKVQQMSTLCSV
ncbi:PHD finger protein 20-like protein 1 isoform X2 [Amia ocellicauda]|uniref:PHD finger protein 20-like protein 1 isoform X2 n=1 Tax=Amia ocellicauda TaxID=2972642 RepID=UPI003464C8ED